MSSPSSTLAQELPFDVLVAVFDAFAELDRWNSPLSTILRICRRWRLCALEHRSMWMKMRLTIDKEADAIYWLRHFRARLVYCGPNPRLDLTIRLVHLKSPRPPPIEPSRAGVYPLTEIEVHFWPNYVELYLKLLDLVAGKRGGLAVFWRNVMLDVTLFTSLKKHNMDTLDRFLQRRTPNLESMRVYGYRTPFKASNVLIPYAPHLHTLVLHSCKPVSISPTVAAKVKLLTVYVEAQSDKLSRQRALETLLTSVAGITYLEIGYDGTPALPWTRPLAFNSLATLKIPGVSGSDLIACLDVPALENLTMCLDTELRFKALLDCKGIPFSRVQKLELHYYHPGPARIADVAEEVEDPMVPTEEMMRLFDRMLNMSKALKSLFYHSSFARNFVLFDHIGNRFPGARLIIT